MTKLINNFLNWCLKKYGSDVECHNEIMTTKNQFNRTFRNSTDDNDI